MRILLALTFLFSACRSEPTCAEPIATETTEGGISSIACER